MRTSVKPFGVCVPGSSSLGLHFGLMLKERQHSQATEKGNYAPGGGWSGWDPAGGQTPGPGARRRAQASHLRQSLGPGECLSSSQPSSRVWEWKGCKSSFCRRGHRWSYIGITPPETDSGVRRGLHGQTMSQSVSDSPGKWVRTQAPTPPCVHQRRPSRRLCRGRRPPSPSPPLPRC